MTSIAKLKDKARKHEQKEDWQAAIAAYQKVLEQQEEEEDLELELALFNRIGDLNLRLGQTDEAVSFYETAADKYAESGFFNNAIALCNKALRHRPDRPAIYLKLSRLCNEQGFHTDARRWILEYAERQVAAGAVEAALTGLEEFAELSDDPEVRELLAQQLAAHDRADEAVEQLRTAYGMRVRAGETEAAAEVAEKANAIDPSVDLASEEVAAPEPAGAGDDFDAGGGAEPGDAMEPAGEPATADADAAVVPGDEGLQGLETRTDTVAEVEAEGLEGMESTTAGAEVDETGAEEISGLEPSFSEQEPPASPDEVDTDTLGGLETFASELDESEEGVDEPAAADLGEGVDAAELEETEAEEAEPLPLLDEGVEDEDEAAAEEAEPLPTLDTGFEDEAVEEEAAEAGAMDLGFDQAEEEEEAAPAGAGASDDGMDLDFGSFDLGFETEEAEAPQVAAEDLDIEAVLNRSRELVSRGLTGEALRELHLLSGSGAGPDVFRDALGVVNEVIRHDENDIGALQRRVEYGARIGDRELLVEAYLDLAEALERLGAETKARAMYERVLDLDASNEAARDALGEAEEEEEAVDLDAILREMGPAEAEPADAGAEGGSDPNFAAMLNQFKAKVTDKTAESDDAGDHYDLGLAFKEMGLIDEAIAEFQAALTGGEERLKVYEELGQCFVMKGQYNVALKVFNRALKVPHAAEDDLLGVYYHLGQCHEELGQRQEARDAYEKVLAIDESFADVPDRMARL